MAKENRVREKFSFLLNLRNALDFDLADEIYNLKRHRQFTGAIRDGLRLVLSLRQGRVDVLIELFPWIADHFVQPPASHEFEQLISQMAMLVEQQAQVIVAPAPGLLIADDDTPISGPRPILTPQIAAPAIDEDDEDDFDLKITEVSGGDSAQNFVNSVMAVCGG